MCLLIESNLFKQAVITLSMESRIHFSVDDVIREFHRQKDVYDTAEKMGKSQEVNRFMLDSFDHELTSPLESAIGLLEASRPILTGSEYDNQLKNLIESIRKLNSSLKVLKEFYFSSLRVQSKETDEKKLVQLFMNSLDEVFSYFPFLNQAQEKPLGPTSGEICSAAQLRLEHALEAYNHTFSSTYNSTWLSREIGRYWLHHHALESRTGISMKRPQRLAKVKTKADYYTHVILPLISNVEEHAMDREAGGSMVVMQIFSDLPNEKNGNITFTVEDNGKGMAPIYDISQIKSTKGSNGGRHGLGILGAQKFAESHGGKLWIESKPGVGTKVHFTIPYSSNISGVYHQ